MRWWGLKPFEVYEPEEPDPDELEQPSRAPYVSPRDMFVSGCIAERLFHGYEKALERARSAPVPQAWKTRALFEVDLCESRERAKEAAAAGDLAQAFDICDRQYAADTRHDEVRLSWWRRNRCSSVVAYLRRGHR